jgi:hypothetical protein
MHAHNTKWSEGHRHLHHVDHRSNLSGQPYDFQYIGSSHNDCGSWWSSCEAEAECGGPNLAHPDGIPDCPTCPYPITVIPANCDIRWIETCLPPQGP